MIKQALRALWLRPRCDNLFGGCHRPMRADAGGWLIEPGWWKCPENHPRPRPMSHLAAWVWS